MQNYKRRTIRWYLWWQTATVVKTNTTVLFLKLLYIHTCIKVWQSVVKVIHQPMRQNVILSEVLVMAVLMYNVDDDCEQRIPKILPRKDYLMLNCGWLCCLLHGMRISQRYLCKNLPSLNNTVSFSTVNPANQKRRKHSKNERGGGGG